MPYMFVTLEVSKLSGWLNADALKNMYCMFVTLEVSKLSGWLNALAYCRESQGGHTMWEEVQSTGSGGRWRATAVHARRAGEGSTAGWGQGTGRSAQGTCCACL